jgi:hypothetical protein
MSSKGAVAGFLAGVKLRIIPPRLTVRRQANRKRAILSLRLSGGRRFRRAVYRIGKKVRSAASGRVGLAVNGVKKLPESMYPRGESDTHFFRERLDALGRLGCHPSHVGYCEAER